MDIYDFAGKKKIKLPKSHLSLFILKRFNTLANLSLVVFIKGVTFKGVCPSDYKTLMNESGQCRNKLTCFGH